jgi:hypothetical protein
VCGLSKEFLPPGSQVQKVQPGKARHQDQWCVGLHEPEAALYAGDVPNQGQVGEEQTQHRRKGVIRAGG